MDIERDWSFFPGVAVGGRSKGLAHCVRDEWQDGVKVFDSDSMATAMLPDALLFIRSVGSGTTFLPQLSLVLPHLFFTTLPWNRK